jgi:hypothetical protein
MILYQHVELRLLLGSEGHVFIERKLALEIPQSIEMGQDGRTCANGLFGKVLLSLWSTEKLQEPLVVAA